MRSYTNSVVKMIRYISDDYYINLVLIETIMTYPKIIYACTKK